MYRGYIKLWRKITDCDIWKIKPFSKGQAWLDLIMAANFAEKKIHFHQRLEEASRGQFVTSVLKLSEKWGWSRCKTKAYIDLLQKLGNISYNTIDKRYIKITICNYDGYQTIEENKKQEIVQEIVQEKGKRSTRERQEIDITKNDKNVEECKENNNTNIMQKVENFLITAKGKKLSDKKLVWFEQFWEAFDYKKGKRNAADAWLNLGILSQEIVDIIIDGAKKESKLRPFLIKKNRTPKMAQGWLADRRWEDDYSDLPKTEEEEDAELMEELRKISEGS